MSLRATTDHIDDYGREHLFEIYDDQWGGSVTALKNTGRGFGRFSHQVLDPKKPWENPIQKGVLELSVWLSSTSLLDDIKDGDEQQFHIIHKIDASQEWAGYIYNDLTTYEENILPFRVTLVAKDFTDLGGKDFLVSSALPDNRETVITTIATLLNEVGFDIPIKTHTSWIEANINSGQDYLRQIYHETKALREFGRTGDESDTAITVEDALNKLCSNHKLILKQTGGAYWIDQLSEYDNPASVQETVYDIDGSLNTAETNVDTTVSANTTDLKVVISSDNRDNSGLPGLKRAKVKFDHRSKVSQIQFPDQIDPNSGFSQTFISDGNQSIIMGIIVQGRLTSGTTSSDGQVRIQAGKYWWDEDSAAGGGWVDSNSTAAQFFDINLSISSEISGVVFAFGSININTTDIPADGDGTIEIDFGTIGSDNGDSYYVASFILDSAISSENSTSINYQLTQSGGFSVVETFEDDWYGDGPFDSAVSALRHDSGDSDITLDSWGRRGQTADKNFHENQLKEPMDLRRGWRRLLTALLKGVYYPHNVLSYDSEFFYYLGGRWDLFTGNFQADLFSLDIVTGTDDFEDIPKFTDETGSGSGSSGGGSTGGGVSQTFTDATYLRLDSSNDPVTGGTTFEIGNNEFRIEDGDSMLVVDGATGQIALGAEPLDDVGLLLDTPARAVTDNTDYDRLKVTNSGALTIAASTTSPIVATAQFDEPNINLASGAAVTNAATVYIESAPTEGDDNWALYAPSGDSLVESLTIEGGALSWKLDTDHEIEFQTPRGETGIIFDINNLGNRSRFDILNTADATVSNRTFSLGFNDDGSNDLIFSKGGGVMLGNTLTINSQLLFDLGQEQNLGENKAVTFAGLTSNGQVDINQTGNTIRVNPTSSGADSYISFRGGNSAAFGWDNSAVRAHIQAGGSKGFSIGVDSNTFGDNVVFEIDTSGDATFSGDVEVQGLLDAETIQTQTLRTTLFKPTTIIGMGGKSIWNATSTVVSIDTGANTIVSEDAVFASGDDVIVSSAIYNQSGFSNVEISITSAGSSVTGGTQYDYTVNTGDDADIGTGDTIVKIDGDLIIVDAEDGTDKPSISGYSDLTGFADSPASGGSADPSWLLTPTKFFYEGLGFSVNDYVDVTSASSSTEITIGDEAIPRGTINNLPWGYVEANGTSEDTYTSTIRTYTRVYPHRFGYNVMRFTFSAAEDNDFDNLNVSGVENQIQIVFDNTEDAGDPEIQQNYNVTQSTRDVQVVEFDLTQLTIGESYDIEVYAHAEFTIDTSNGNEQFARTQLNFEPVIEVLGS